MTQPPRIVVDVDSGVAPWRQVRDQIVDLIQLGQFGPLPLGSRLPAIRQLAKDLGLAPGTVARAYKELEADGTLKTARRHGTIVAAVPSAQTSPLDRLASDYISTAQSLGISREDAVEAVEKLWPEADDIEPA